MDYAYSPIQERKPVEGIGIHNYIKEIKEQKERRIPKHYYVSYSTKYADTIDIKCYAQEGVNQLTVEYERLEDNGENEGKKNRIVIAENPKTMGDFQKVKLVIQSYLKDSSVYATEEPLHPEKHIAELKQMGWNMTQEGMDFMLVTKQDGIVEIKRTAFITEELEEMTGAEIRENIQEHNLQKELKMIETLKQYIVKTYEELPSDITPELQEYKQKVQKYSDNEKSGIKNAVNLLDISFKEMKPIKEDTDIIPLMQRSFLQNIRTYLDMIPASYRDSELHSCLTEYLRIREDAITEKENNNGKLSEKSECIFKLYRLIGNYMNKQAEKKREELSVKVEKNLSLSEKVAERE